MEEVYGREQASGHSRLSRGKRWPIFVATMIITLGWILALAPVSPAPNGEGLSLQTGADLIKLFIPNNHPVILGFLGAYFFALNTVLRRYVRRDLKPSAYATITVRIFIAVILAWLLALLSVDPGVVGILAFFVGIVPDTGIALLQETLRKNSGIGRFIPTYKEDHPLTKLEGIDLYERARLEDEGVTNVQSLAHHDLIDLMIETRIPVPRLVDWVDQAILYLHVHRMEDKEPSWTNNFNAVGIRNASDLLRVYSDADRNPTDFDFETIVREQARIKQLHALMSSLHDDEWLDHVLHWRKPYKVETVVRSAEPRLPIDIHPEQDMPPAQASPKAVPLGLITDEAPAGTS
jgi:hypothetical protein